MLLIRVMLPMIRDTDIRQATTDIPEIATRAPATRAVTRAAVHAALHHVTWLNAIGTTGSAGTRSVTDTPLIPTIPVPTPALTRPIPVDGHDRVLGSEASSIRRRRFHTNTKRRPGRDTNTKHRDRPTNTNMAHGRGRPSASQATAAPATFNRQER